MEEGFASLHMAVAELRLIVRAGGEANLLREKSLPVLSFAAKTIKLLAERASAEIAAAGNDAGAIAAAAYRQGITDAPQMRALVAVERITDDLLQASAAGQSTMYLSIYAEALLGLTEVPSDPALEPALAGRLGTLEDYFQRF